MRLGVPWEGIAGGRTTRATHNPPPQGIRSQGRILPHQLTAAREACLVVAVPARGGGLATFPLLQKFRAGKIPRESRLQPPSPGLPVGLGFQRRVKSGSGDPSVIARKVFILLLPPTLGTEAMDFPIAASRDLVPPTTLAPLPHGWTAHCAPSLEGRSWGWAAPWLQQGPGGLGRTPPSLPELVGPHGSRQWHEGQPPSTCAAGDPVTTSPAGLGFSGGHSDLGAPSSTTPASGVQFQLLLCPPVASPLLPQAPEHP